MVRSATWYRVRIAGVYTLLDWTTWIAPPAALLGQHAMGGQEETRIEER